MVHFANGEFTVKKIEIHAAGIKGCFAMGAGGKIMTDCGCRVTAVVSETELGRLMALASDRMAAGVGFGAFAKADELKKRLLFTLAP